MRLFFVTFYDAWSIIIFPLTALYMDPHPPPWGQAVVEFFKSTMPKIQLSKRYKKNFCEKMKNGLNVHPDLSTPG